MLALIQGFEDILFRLTLGCAPGLLLCTSLSMLVEGKIGFLTSQETDWLKDHSYEQIENYLECIFKQGKT